MAGSAGRAVCSLLCCVWKRSKQSSWLPNVRLLRGFPLPTTRFSFFFPNIIVSVLPPLSSSSIGFSSLFIDIHHVSSGFGVLWPLIVHGPFILPLFLTRASMCYPSPTPLIVVMCIYCDCAERFFVIPLFRIRDMCMLESPIAQSYHRDAKDVGPDIML